MKTLLVNIIDDKKEDAIKNYLSSLKDVSYEDLDDTIYSDLSEDQVVLLNERLEAYEKNPVNIISLVQFKKNLKKKYGF